MGIKGDTRSLNYGSFRVCGFGTIQSNLYINTNKEPHTPFVAAIYPSSPKPHVSLAPHFEQSPYGLHIAPYTPPIFERTLSPGILEVAYNQEVTNMVTK